MITGIGVPRPSVMGEATGKNRFINNCVQAANMDLCRLQNELRVRSDFLFCYFVFCIIPAIIRCDLFRIFGPLSLPHACNCVFVCCDISME